MKIEDLMKLKNSESAPFNHDEYTVWLHNKIVGAIAHDLWQFREVKSKTKDSTYAACNHIMDFESLKII